MVKIIWTDSALNSLDDIAEFIALDNSSAASKLVCRVMSVVDRLQDFPESGRLIPEIADLPYKEIIVNPCRVLYRYDRKMQTVFILAVIRQEMDLLRYINQGH
ncbi:type II toxin-antitoxin system RelE/ParE family toxin [Thiomicrorhabdus sp. Kp2]|uniref:type II toxin-antitoxin system RelE/ParE family toxin n=1 Tax=Thiomicrorhabdus sp. Kp2 TaxID=1123518 RepID=UPI00041D0AD8|nr:type II toxin-antitoxin system RelE/ParE family toxin [Thiomicrorhabdus sp. Kp2]